MYLRFFRSSCTDTYAYLPYLGLDVHLRTDSECFAVVK